MSVLVMCHTRELAFQISKEYERFSKYMPSVKVRGLRELESGRCLGEGMGVKGCSESGKWCGEGTQGSWKLGM